MTKKQMTMLAAATAMAIFSSCGNKQQQGVMPSAVYKTTKVTKSDVTINQKYSATIRGRQDIEVYPQVGGTLQKLCVTEGQKVKKGQVLFIIDQVPYRAALNTAEASLKAAEAQEATQTAQNTLLTAKAQVAQAKAQVVNARNSLSYTTVVSPSDGVIGTLPYRQGALVGSSMPQPLTTVSDNNEMYVYFSMTESQYLNLIRQYESSEKAIEAMPDLTLQLVDGTDYEIKGRVESVSGVVDRATGSVQLRAAFSNPQHILHSGSTGNIILPVTYKDVLTIPAGAAVQTQDKFNVYIVDSKGIAHSNLVEILPESQGKTFVVTSGLKGGEEIVAEGAGMVHEGQDVKKLGK